MKVTIRGIEEEIDINDDDSLLSACDALASASVKRIEPNNHTKALKQMLQGLHYWHVKNGALLFGAAITGSEGIGMNGALSSHNFIGKLLGEPPLQLPELDEAGPNESLEGDESEIVDENGSPIVLPDAGDEL